MSEQRFWQLLAVTVLFGLAGGLIGYGYYGTSQAAAVGAGLGLLWAPLLGVLLFLLHLFS